jgi:hypothetical protein
MTLRFSSAGSSTAQWLADPGDARSKRTRASVAALLEQCKAHLNNGRNGAGASHSGQACSTGAAWLRPVDYKENCAPAQVRTAAMLRESPLMIIAVSDVRCARLHAQQAEYLALSSLQEAGRARSASGALPGAAEASPADDSETAKQAGADAYKAGDYEAALKVSLQPCMP